MTQLFKNNGSVSLTYSIGSLDTSIEVNNGAVLPVVSAPDYFLLTLIGKDVNGNENAWEIVKVTQVNQNILTVVRGQEGTTPVAWPEATRCEMRLTAGSMEVKLDKYSVTLAATNKTLVNRERYSVRSATKTITLPGSPAAGWEVAILVGNFTDTLVVRNGQLIMGIAENMTIDKANVTVTLLFVGGDQGWRII